MWFQRSGLYFLADENSMPVLVKYDESVSYLPVFETKEAATIAAKNLTATKSNAISNANHTVNPTPFSWSGFKQSQEHMKQQGHMLFVYPMSPQEYGQK